MITNLPFFFSYQFYHLKNDIMTNLHVFPTIKLIKIEVEQQSNSITLELIKIINLFGVLCSYKGN